VDSTVIVSPWVPGGSRYLAGRSNWTLFSNGRFEVLIQGLNGSGLYKMGGSLMQQTKR
jgi:hypothetical protein